MDVKTPMSVSFRAADIGRRSCGLGSDFEDDSRKFAPACDAWFARELARPLGAPSPTRPVALFCSSFVICVSF